MVNTVEILDQEAITKEEFKARERQANMFASAFLLCTGPHKEFCRFAACEPRRVNTP